MTPRFKLDDTVKVKNGVIAEDFDIDLSGRVGRISGWETEDLEEPLYYVNWDSVTLNEHDLDSIRYHEENGVDWNFSCLYESELESIKSRDTSTDVESAIKIIQDKIEKQNNQGHR
jgi:hypothetical protein